MLAMNREFTRTLEGEMIDTERHHMSMSAAMEDLEARRIAYWRTMDASEENRRGAEPGCWNAEEDFEIVFTTRDELLVLHED